MMFIFLLVPVGLVGIYLNTYGMYSSGISSTISTDNIVCTTLVENDTNCTVRDYGSRYMTATDMPTYRVKYRINNPDSISLNFRVFFFNPVYEVNLSTGTS